MFNSANNLRLALVIFLLVRGGNCGPALSANKNAGIGIVWDQRDLPNDILLEMEMDTVGAMIRIC